MRERFFLSEQNNHQATHVLIVTQLFVVSTHFHSITNRNIGNNCSIDFILMNSVKYY